MGPRIVASLDNRTELDVSEKTGLLLCGHGSRLVEANREFEQAADLFAGRLRQFDVERAFLEFEKPTIGEGLAALHARGNSRILVVPGFLFAAGHLKSDIPAIISNYAAQQPDARIELGRELGIDPKMLGAATARIRAAIGTAAQHISAQESVLVVVGRGAADPDPNAKVFTALRWIWKEVGFAWGEVAYSGLTFPLVEPALEHAARLGYRRVVIFPYILFAGRLVDGIRTSIERVAARHPTVDFVAADHFKGHPLVVETLVDRAKELLGMVPK